MKRRALDVLACPNCFGPLSIPPGESFEELAGSLLCEQEGLAFPVVGGIPRLVRPADRPALERFGSSFASAWARMGWMPEAEADLLDLPFVRGSGTGARIWAVKARSVSALFSLLDSNRPMRILDLGAGSGWLSYRLSDHGFEVFAADALLRPPLGLEAATVYLQKGAHFERIWADMLQLPFRSGSFDMAICNSSLHYSKALPQTLEQIHRVLRVGGTLVVMNSPVHRDRMSATRAQADFRRKLRNLGASEEVAGAYRHFVDEDLLRLLLEHIGPVADQHFDPGRLFRWIRWVKGHALGMELAKFPLLWVRKES